LITYKTKHTPRTNPETIYTHYIKLESTITLTYFELARKLQHRGKQINKMTVPWDMTHAKS